MFAPDPRSVYRFDKFEYLVNANKEEARRELQVLWRIRQGRLYAQALGPAVADAEEAELPACFCGDKYETHDGNGPAQGNDNDDDAHYAVRTSCRHFFGKSCLVMWCSSTVQQNAFACPNCRHALFEDNVTGQIRTRYYRRLDWFVREAHELGVEAIRKMQEALGQYNDDPNEIAEQLTEVHQAAQVAFLSNIIDMIQLFEEQGAALHWEVWEKLRLFEDLSEILKEGADRLEDEVGVETDPDRFLDLTEAMQRHKALAAAALAESVLYGQNYTHMRRSQELAYDRSRERHHRRSAGNGRG